jgi:hypothetical protein
LADLNRRYGRGFGTELDNVPEERWSGPLASSYGLHFVWVHERVDASRPNLAEVRAQVTSSLLDEHVMPRAVAEHLELLRARYNVRLLRAGEEVVR